MSLRERLRSDARYRRRSRIQPTAEATPGKRAVAAFPLLE
jgi:hypothetical protein